MFWKVSPMTDNTLNGVLYEHFRTLALASLHYLSLYFFSFSISTFNAFSDCDNIRGCLWEGFPAVVVSVFAHRSCDLGSGSQYFVEGDIKAQTQQKQQDSGGSQKSKVQVQQQNMDRH